MINYSKFTLNKTAIFTLIALAFCFYAGDSLAQSELGKGEIDHAKPMDPLTADHSVDVKDSPQQVFSPQTSTTTINRENPLPAKKEHNVSGEGKKAEPAPSTLSFNIFLYIVDKFKAD